MKMFDGAKNTRDNKISLARTWSILFAQSVKRVLLPFCTHIRVVQDVKRSQPVYIAFKTRILKGFDEQSMTVNWCNNYLQNKPKEVKQNFSKYSSGLK